MVTVAIKCPDTWPDRERVETPRLQSMRDGGEERRRRRRRRRRERMGRNDAFNAVLERSLAAALTLRGGCL